MKVFLECKPDEMLARVAGVPPCVIVHSPGKGNVAKLLGKHSGVIGMVDEDLGSAEPGTFRHYAQVSDTYDLRLRVQKDSKNRLVVVCPKLEDWLIKTAKTASIKMEDFSMSENPRALHADINARLPNLKRLLLELLKRESPRLLHLKALLTD
jgi:hypothetical protein